MMNIIDEYKQIDSLERLEYDRMLNRRLSLVQEGTNSQLALQAARTKRARNRIKRQSATNTTDLVLNVLENLF